MVLKPKQLNYEKYCKLLNPNITIVQCAFCVFSSLLNTFAVENGQAGWFPWWGGETKLPIFVTMPFSVHNICVTMPYDHHHAITPIELWGRQMMNRMIVYSKILII